MNYYFPYEIEQIEALKARPKVTIEKYRLEDMPKRLLCILGTSKRGAWEEDIPAISRCMKEVLIDSGISAKVITFAESTKTPSASIPHDLYHPSTIEEVFAVIDGVKSGDFILLKEGDIVRPATVSGIDFFFNEAMRILKGRRQARCVIAHHAFQMRKAK